jgi:putative ABC transport system permease protein
VVERTKEIGIRRAIGATQRDILLQFLTESVLLSLLGGMSGVLVSYGITTLIYKYFPAQVTLSSVLIAFGVSSLVGIGFGVFPARKAANLSPIEAIRYE